MLNIKKHSIALTAIVALMGILFTLVALPTASLAEEAALSGTISTNGSTSMEEVMGALSEQFMADHPEVKISYDPTGSGTGVESASNGSADIGLASRKLKDEEIAKGLEPVTVALDGIAMIVNQNNAVEDLTLQQVADIFTGKITNWKDVGGADQEIATIGREAGSGTRDGFESITETGDANKLAQELTSTGAVIEAVKNNEAAIGYASFSAVTAAEGVKAVKIDGVEVTEENIANGSYVIQRPFNLVLVKDAERTPQAQAFIDYMTSADADELIKGAGAVPVPHDEAASEDEMMKKVIDTLTQLLEELNKVYGENK